MPWKHTNLKDLQSGSLATLSPCPISLATKCSFPYLEKKKDIISVSKLFLRINEITHVDNISQRSLKIIKCSYCLIFSEHMVGIINLIIRKYVQIVEITFTIISKGVCQPQWDLLDIEVLLHILFCY